MRNLYMRAFAIASALVAAVSTGMHASAAGPAAALDGEVIVAIPEAFPAVRTPIQAHVLAITMRSPGNTDIIVLNPAIRSGAALGDAISQTVRHRAQFPVVNQHAFLVLTSVRMPREERVPGALKAALAEVSRQPMARIGNLGQGRWQRFSVRSLVP